MTVDSRVQDTDSDVPCAQAQEVNLKLHSEPVDNVSIRMTSFVTTDDLIMRSVRKSWECQVYWRMIRGGRVMGGTTDWMVDLLGVEMLAFSRLISPGSWLCRRDLWESWGNLRVDH